MPMELVLISQFMGVNILAHGKIIDRMVLEWRHGLMVINMRASFNKGGDIILAPLIRPVEISL